MPLFGRTPPNASDVDEFPYLLQVFQLKSSCTHEILDSSLNKTFKIAVLGRCSDGQPLLRELLTTKNKVVNTAVRPNQAKLDR